MKKTIALVSSAVALTLTLGSFNVSAKAGLVKRLGGQDRYGTSSAIVGFGWEKGQTDYAIIASGEGFADALSAAPLAKKHNAPIILTEGKSLNSKAKVQLERLGVKNVIIVGGTGSISANTEKQIKDLGISIKRIYGQDRYETSLAVAKELGIEKGIVVTNGTGFADSLSMASIAANKGMAIILTKASNLPKNTEEFLKTNEYSKSYVLGGPVIVSENIEKGLKNSKRLYGQDRYDTNAAILKEFVSEIDLSNLYIASGVNYPDALSASALAAKNNGPIMLVDNKLRPSITPFVKVNYEKFENVFPLGGEGVLTNDIVNKIVDGAKTEEEKRWEEFVNKNTKELSAGNHLVGKDIDPGIYEVNYNGSGNFVVYASDGSLLTNEVSQLDMGMKKYRAVLPEGAKVEISSMSVNMKPIQSKLMPYGEVDIYAGIWMVGSDITKGRYKVTTTGSSGNFIIYGKNDEIKVNEILGTDEIAVKEITIDLQDDDVIDISTLNNVKLTPIK